MIPSYDADVIKLTQSEGEIAMSAYDTVLAGMTALGLGVLGFVATHGETDFHMNASGLEAVLQTQAQSALDDAGLNWALVKMDGQTAILSGNAPDDAAAEVAQSTVLKSAGAGGWLNGGIVSVKTEFGEAPDLAVVSPYLWRAIKTEDNRLILAGSVPSQTLKDNLSAAASDFIGQDVEDRTELAAGTPEGDWAGIATFGLSQLQYLDSGEARLRDQRLTISGIAMDDANRIAVTAAVSNLSDPWTGVARVSGPSLWSAEHSDDTLILSGSCETDADKTEIAAIARDHFDGEVVDQMTVATSEYDDWIDGVRLGLPHFADFENGEMAFEPEETGFSFEGEASPSTLRFLSEDMAKLEGDYAVDIGAAPVAVDLSELEGVDLGDDPLIACQASFDLILQVNAVVFETGSAVISRESGETLDKIMAVSSNCADRLNFEIGGHTDSSGDAAANISLSRARAQAVANYMQTAGFSGDRLLVIGYGPDRPIADNSTPEGRAENRRIEFSVQEWSE